MDPMLVQYALFILVALLIIGAVVALNRWLYRQTKVDASKPHTWAKFDIKLPETRTEQGGDAPLNEEDEEEAELHTRARQNGHSMNGHKPLN